MSSPASSVLLGHSDFLISLPTYFVSSQAGTTAVLVDSFPAFDEHFARRAWRLFTEANHTDLLSGEIRISQVPGEPICMHAPLFDPGWPIRSRLLRATGIAFQRFETVGP